MSNFRMQFSQGVTSLTIISRVSVLIIFAVLLHDIAITSKDDLCPVCELNMFKG